MNAACRDTPVQTSRRAQPTSHEEACMRARRSWRYAATFTVALIALIGGSIPAAAATPSITPKADLGAAGPFDPAFRVRDTDDIDDGACDVTHCSLREAILGANDLPGSDWIYVELFGSGPIEIAAPLPPITEDVVIENISSGGCCGPQYAYVDGPGSGIGLELASGTSRIDGLVFGDFQTGIAIREAAANSSIVHGGTGFGPFDAIRANTGDGIVVEASDVRIGREPSAFSDRVAVVNSGGDGIVITGTAVRVTIDGVEIRNNGGLGIDISPDGPDASDDDDLDTGPNGLQNAPTITSVTTIAQQTRVEGTFEGAPFTTYELELYSVDSCDSSGFGEGGSSSFTTSVSTDSSGSGSFDMGTPFGLTASQSVAGTATAPDGSTSEFGNCFANTVVLRSDLNLAFDDEAEAVGEGEPLRYALTVRNDGPTDATGVVVQHALPTGATFGKAVTDRGSCSQAAGVVTCAIGSLSTQFSNTATITVDIRVAAAGIATSTATVSANEPDPDATDNDITETTTVSALTPATFTVNASNDANDGSCDATHCSLREAIIASNGNPGRDTIVFELSGSNLIQPASPGLPAILGPVVIDATTDDDFGGGPNPVVELAGNLAPNRTALQVFGGDSEVRGLILNRWSQAVDIDRWGESVVAGNWFGLDPTGLIRTANSGAAVSVGTSDNTVGGTTPADRNVISGSSSGVRVGHSFNDGIRIEDNVIRGNYIGLNAPGTAAITNTVGVTVFDSLRTIIGGSADGARNVIGGSTQTGINVGDGGVGIRTADTVIQGNYVGLNAGGTAAVPNGRGIEVHGSVDRTIVGGTTLGAGNTISGNSFEGIFVFSGAPDTAIVGNRIGTDPSGLLPLPNGRRGIELQATRPVVGGLSAAEANIIAFNGADGVLLNGAAAIFGNSIHSNGQLGIDRLPDGVSPGSAGFTFPTLTSVVTHNGTTTAAGTLSSSANTSYRIELFDNAACDPSGFGEGERFAAATTVTTTGAGTATFSVEFPAALAIGRVVTSTATSTGASPLNSEFSACRTNVAPPPESATGSGAGGTTTTTDPEGDGATAADPIESSVSVPAGGVSGAIQIDEAVSAGSAPVGFEFFGVDVVITAPPQTQLLPLVLTFMIDQSAIPDGESAASIVVFRNTVPVAACTAADSSATPDPCVFLRETVAGGDIRVTVRTSAASTWNFGVSSGLPPFPFSGFFSPVDNLPVFNQAKAGAAIPVKFSLDGDQGLGIFADNYPRSTVTACDSTAPVDSIEQTVSPGATELTYDPVADRYTYVWKTQKSWAGTCRQLVVGLSDGTFHRVNFDFRK
jgi:uncharacterized repeat protein (TIGR01451 family)/CSLREA domain-containing protein